MIKKIKISANETIGEFLNLTYETMISYLMVNYSIFLPRTRNKIKNFTLIIESNIASDVLLSTLRKRILTIFIQSLSCT